MAPASRRGFLGALAALSGAAAPVATVAIAATTCATPAHVHPDAELLAAGAAYSAAIAEQTRAEAAYVEAGRRSREAQGWCPPELLFNTSDDDELLEVWRKVQGVSGRWYPPEGDYFEATGWEEWHSRFDGPMLRGFLQWLPAIYGRAGRTPKLIRRFKALLPIAEARDASDAFWDEHFRREDADTAWRAAMKAVEVAEVGVAAHPATTLEGFAVKARTVRTWTEYNASRSGWTMKLPASVESLIASALALPTGEV